jgi:hypothetical protein
MNDLEKYFTENTGRLIHKWKHYFEIYDTHFSRFRGTDVHVVEFGVSQENNSGQDCKVANLGKYEVAGLEHEQMTLIYTSIWRGNKA